MAPKRKSSSEPSTSHQKRPRTQGKDEENDAQAQSEVKPRGRAMKGESVPITAALLGARPGDLLRGLEGCDDVKNVMLRIESGIVQAAPKKRSQSESCFGREKVIAAIARHFRFSTSSAELRYADCPMDASGNHLVLGSGCSHHAQEGCSCEPAARFTILSQGIWQEFADLHGNGAELEQMVRERRVVSWQDVLRLMYTPGQLEGKLLILRLSLFEIVAGQLPLAPNDPRLVAQQTVVDAIPPWGVQKKGALKADGAIYELSGELVQLPAMAASFPRSDVVAAVLEALEGIVPQEHLTETVKATVDVLQHLSVGGLKSCLQKTVRFHGLVVEVRSDLKVRSAVVAAICVALLFVDKGTFSPELQLFTRGCTAAFKRTAVILVEDAWVEGSEAAISALTALAVACQQMADYEPPRSAIIATLQLIARAAMSPVVIAWHSADKPTSKATTSASSQASLANGAKFLTAARSFASDMAMFDKVAQSSKSGHLKLSRADFQPTSMPLCHIIDQHMSRGIAHVLGGSISTFGKRFAEIFSKCTGMNPRRVKLSANFEEEDWIREVRIAQRCCLDFSIGVKPSFLPHQTGTVDVKIKLDTGVLAAAVGPVPAKVRAGPKDRPHEVLVLLGIRCPEDEMVMLKPVRATRDLFTSLTDNERQEAISYVRTLKHKVSSPLLPDAKLAEYKSGCWHLDGLPWSDVVSKGRLLQLPMIAAPSWLPTNDSASLEALLENDHALQDSLAHTGDGLVADAENLICNLTAAAGHAAALRAVALLRQQYVSIAMPTPSLSGGLGSDQLAAYDGDWRVYRLLALVARLAPAALRPSMPPNFHVQDAALLREIERWMLRGARLASANSVCSQTSSTVSVKWEHHSHWKVMAAAETKLMEHQQAAIDRMHQRDKEAECGGHFLIMDTGLGKTLTSLVYGYRWLCKYGGDMVVRILWITPAGTVDNLVHQLKDVWKVPVHVIPRLSSAKKSKQDNSDTLRLEDYSVNIIHADHLRTAIDKGLAEAAAASFIVFDEVDEMYAPTLRTSAARRICQLCPKFVAQTATPMRKNESQLRMWLADTCAFPVDSNNLLVAASGMVSIQMELGIAAQEEEILVPMTEEARKACRQLMTSRSAGQWLEMAKVVQSHTDEAMVKQAVAMAKTDRAKHKKGGILLVADTKQHSERLIELASKHIRTGDFSSLESKDAASYGVVVITKDKDRGYNSACRLGAMVTGAYAGNAASRHQIRGRIRRLGQTRKEVRFVTVVMENSLLHLLHKRHSAVDTMNITLEQLGQKFASEVLKGLTS